MLWRNVSVGDIVHLSNNETVPADILLLRTSNPHGVCYIDTCDLDGETNLKLREVVRGFIDKQQLFTPSKFTSRVEVDLPTTKIFKFNGALIHPTGERVPVSTENLLLRESRLKVRWHLEFQDPSMLLVTPTFTYIIHIFSRFFFFLQNTDFIEGIVVYAGHETKAMLNNSGPRYKRSQLEQQMNYDVIWYVILADDENSPVAF